MPDRYTEASPDPLLPATGAQCGWSSVSPSTVTLAVVAVTAPVRGTGRRAPLPRVERPSRPTRTRRGDPAGAHRCEELTVSDADFGPSRETVFGPDHSGDGLELIQLLTPEGERVEHPDFAYEGDDDIRGMYRDLV